MVFNIGVKNRVYTQYIKRDRKLEFHEKLDIDLDDVASYPPSVLQEYQEKIKYDAFIKRKEEKINKVEDAFHDFLTKRATELTKFRDKKGLRIKKPKKRSPIEDFPEFEDIQVPGIKAEVV